MKRVVARHIAVDHIFGAPFCARRNNNTNLILIYISPFCENSFSQQINN